MIIDKKYSLFFLKLPFSKEHILKICQQSSITINMPKLPHAEFSRVMRYEYVHASSSNSVFILKNCQLQRA